jgi:hypothetical protein
MAITKHQLLIEAWTPKHGDERDTEADRLWLELETRVREVAADPRYAGLRMRLDGEELEPELILTPELRAKMLEATGKLQDAGFMTDANAATARRHLDAVTDGANIWGTPLQLLDEWLR